METVAAYVSRYYKDQIPNTSGVFVFQEEARRRTATTWNEQDKDGQLGWTAVRIVQTMLNEPNWRDQTTEEYRGVVEQELKTCKYPENVRGQVKRIWTWPLQGYLPWNDLPAAESKAVICACRKLMHDAKFGLVNGKLYLRIPGFVEALWSTVDMKAVLPDLKAPLRANVETSHITLVNSDVLAKCDRKILDNLLQKYETVPVDLECTKVAHTVSLDWARFSICVTVHLQSSCLAQFISDFNSVCSANLRVPPFITVAIMPR